MVGQLVMLQPSTNLNLTPEVQSVTDMNMLKTTTFINSLRKYGEIRKIAHVVKHEKYTNNKISVNHDVCIITLDAPSTKRPIRLRSAPVASGMPVKVIGYGATGWTQGKPNPPLKTLQQAILTTAPLNKCIDNTIIPPNNKDFNIPVQTDPSILCAQSAPGVSACNGDSGGPLFIEGNTPELVGVVSFGPQFCNKFNKNTPSNFFANVSALRPWITAATNRGLAAVRK